MPVDLFDPITGKDITFYGGDPIDIIVRLPGESWMDYTYAASIRQRPQSGTALTYFSVSTVYNVEGDEKTWITLHLDGDTGNAPLDGQTRKIPSTAYGDLEQRDPDTGAVVQTLAKFKAKHEQDVTRDTTTDAPPAGAGSGGDGTVPTATFAALVYDLIPTAVGFDVIPAGGIGPPGAAGPRGTSALPGTEIVDPHIVGDHVEYEFVTHWGIHPDLTPYYADNPDDIPVEERGWWNPATNQVVLGLPGTDTEIITVRTGTSPGIVFGSPSVDDQGSIKIPVISTQWGLKDNGDVYFEDDPLLVPLDEQAVVDPYNLTVRLANI